MHSRPGTDADPDRYANANANANSDSNADANADGYAYSNTDGNIYANAIAHTGWPVYAVTFHYGDVSRQHERVFVYYCRARDRNCRSCKRRFWASGIFGVEFFECFGYYLAAFVWHSRSGIGHVHQDRRFTAG